MNNSNVILIDSKMAGDSIVTKAFLDLEKIDVNLYRSVSLYRSVFARNVFGGQLVGQALAAAMKSLPPAFMVHSLHSYFIRGGDVDLPIEYEVDRTRDGNTYSSRSVKAIQNGSVIFTMQASFKKEESEQFEHQFTMPVVPEPETLMNTKQIMQHILQSENITQGQHNFITKYLQQEDVIERRPVNKDTFLMHKSLEPKQCSWVKAVGQIGNDVQFNQCVAAYISDTILLRSAILPAGANDTVSPKQFMITSLDHSIWFHNPVQADEWLLYEVESPFCGDGRSLVLGRLWRRDGVLAMSVAQEGVVRMYKSRL